MLAAPALEDARRAPRGRPASSSWTKTSRIGVVVISWADMMPWLASWAHCLSIGRGPGHARARRTMSQPSRSMRAFAATARSLKPGTVRETHPEPGAVAGAVGQLGARGGAHVVAREHRVDDADARGSWVVLARPRWPPPDPAQVGKAGPWSLQPAPRWRPPSVTLTRRRRWRGTSRPSRSSRAARVDARLRARGDLPDRDARPDPTTTLLTRRSRRSRTQVRRRGLWAAHLPPELGGHGLRPGAPRPHARGPRPDPVRPASSSATTRPTSGNAELLAVGMEMTGRDDIRERWLEPLLAGTMRSGFSMTEPETAGSDPQACSRPARSRDGDEWVINGHKWYTTNGSVADILIVMAVTNPDVHPYQGSSMFVVPVGTPGRHDRARRGLDGRPRGHLRPLRQPRRDHLRRRPRAGRPPHRPRGLGLRAGPGAARPGPDPPLHALARPVPAGVRHDVRARAQPLHPRLAARREADRPELDRRLARPRCTPRA